MKKSTDKINIAGFPGVGKSKAAEVLKGIAYDAESSDFHWMKQTNNKTDAASKIEANLLDPCWPDNYHTLIKMLAYETDGLKDFKDLTYICISTHEEVLRYLRKYHIPFVIVLPGNKDETIARYRERGNSESFIKKVEENWDSWMENFRSYDMPIIRLKPDMYLSDLLDRYSTYDYLKSKIKDVEERILDLEEDPSDDPNGEILNNLCEYMDRKGNKNG